MIVETGDIYKGNTRECKAKGEGKGRERMKRGRKKECMKFSGYDEKVIFFSPIKAYM